MLYSLDVFLHANRRSSFRSRFEITELLTYPDANYSIGPHQKCYVRNLKRGGGEFWVAQILKELLSQLSAILGSCPCPCCRRGQKWFDRYLTCQKAFLPSAILGSCPRPFCRRGQKRFDRYLTCQNTCLPMGVTKVSFHLDSQRTQF